MLSLVEKTHKLSRYQAPLIHKINKISYVFLDDDIDSNNLPDDELELYFNKLMPPAMQRGRVEGQEIPATVRLHSLKHLRFHLVLLLSPLIYKLLETVQLEMTLTFTFINCTLFP